jgi:hypothetical protein
MAEASPLTIRNHHGNPMAVSFELARPAQFKMNNSVCLSLGVANGTAGSLQWLFGMALSHSLIVIPYAIAAEVLWSSEC